MDGARSNSTAPRPRPDRARLTIPARLVLRADQALNASFDLVQNRCRTAAKPPPNLCKRPNAVIKETRD
jgi:hypothetical protein